MVLQHAPVPVNIVSEGMRGMRGQAEFLLLVFIQVFKVNAVKEGAAGILIITSNGEGFSFNF